MWNKNIPKKREKIFEYYIDVFQIIIKHAHSPGVCVIILTCIRKKWKRKDDAGQENMRDVLVYVLSLTFRDQEPTLFSNKL